MKTTERPLAERISKGLAAITSANVVGVALKGLSILVLARFLLSPEEYGLLFLALSVVTFTQLFTDLGIARSAARYVSEYQETDAGQVPHIIRTALTYNLATIAVVGAALLAFDDQIAGLVDEPSIAPFVAIGAVYVAARSLTVFSRRLFQGLNRVTYSALVTALTRGGEFVFVVGLAVLTGEVMGAFLGFVVSYVVAALVGGAVLYRRFYSRFPKAPAMEPGLERRLFEYNLPLTTTKGAGQLLSKTDIVLLGYFWNPVVVGVYTLGLQIAEFIATPAASLGFVISPTFGEHVAVVLSRANWRQLLVPVGFAHGFVTLEPDTEVVYKVTAHYAPDHNTGVHYADAELGIEWPYLPEALTVSERDAALPSFAEWRLRSPF